MRDEPQELHVGRGPRRILSDADFAKWQRANIEAFDRLPDDVRMAIRDTGVEVDCMILERVLATGMPEREVIQTIEEMCMRQRMANLGLSVFKGMH